MRRQGGYHGMARQQNAPYAMDQDHDHEWYFILSKSSSKSCCCYLLSSITAMNLVVTLSLVAGLCGRLVYAVSASGPRDVRGCEDSVQVVERDVVVIGGGSSGAFAAVKLKRMGKSVAVVERREAFGGHTSTYRVPGTNTTIDFGVQGYGDEEVIRNHFASFDIQLESHPISETSMGTPNYVDFRDGETVEGFNSSINLGAFREQSVKYPYLYYSTRLPDPVPEDLLLPFRDFLTKHGLEDAAYGFYYNLEGFGDLLETPALYALRYLNREYLAALDPGFRGALVTARHYNQELYVASQRLIGDDAFVGSYVVEASRSEKGVSVTAKTPDGVVEIRAAKLLVTMPLLDENMEPLALDEEEWDLFRSFEATGWYVGLIRAEGLPEGFAYQNTRADTEANLPELPALYQMSPTTVAGVYLVRYGSVTRLDDDFVKGDMLETFERVRGAVVGDDEEEAEGLEPVELLAYSSHWPFNLRVSAGDVAGGFYSRLDDLQGHRSTWYTGAAVISHSTGALWNFTDYLVDRMYAEE